MFEYYALDKSLGNNKQGNVKESKNDNATYTQLTFVRRFGVLAYLLQILDVI